MNLAQIIAIAETAVTVIWPFLLIAIPVVTGLIFKAFKSKEAKVAFAAAVDVAYLVVHQMSRKTDNKIDDKLAEALKVMKETLGRELTVTEKKEAVVKLKAKHEAKKFPNLLNIKEVGGFIGGIFGFGKEDKK